MQRAQAAIYAALFVILAGSGLLFLSQYGTSVRFWVGFTTVYLLMLVVYTIYLFVLLFLRDVRPRTYPRYGGQKIAVIIPCFNEDPELVEESIRTVLDGEGRKQVIVIDDGSTNGVQSKLRELAAELSLSLHEFSENRGKREALHHAVTRMLDDDVVYVAEAISWTETRPPSAGSSGSSGAGSGATSASRSTHSRTRGVARSSSSCRSCSGT